MIQVIQYYACATCQKLFISAFTASVCCLPEAKS